MTIEQVFDKTVLTIPTPEYKYITKLDEALEAIEYIKQWPIIEVDTETTGLDPYTSKIVLLQIGTPTQAFVFDVRGDTNHSEFDMTLFHSLLIDKSILKILQNAVFDMKMIKCNHDFYIENIYDTMLAEQILNLGITFGGNDLKSLVKKYLNLVMDKEPGGTFQDYDQTFKPFQLEYAAKDVVILTLIRELQLLELERHELMGTVRLEMEFTKPLCEMELNGINIDKTKWRAIMANEEAEKQSVTKIIDAILAETDDQSTLFGVSNININSPKQLLNSLNKLGLPVEDTSEPTLKKFKGLPIIDALLDYRKAGKLITTYGEPMLAKIHSVTGRLHTRFRQMVSTGRMSSSAPNLQNIPGKQKFRSCFVAKEGCALVTADMSGAELRILGNLSKDAEFVYCYSHGIDLHTKTASGVFKVSMEQAALGKYRKPAKAVGFGICYGMSKYGLAARLMISEKEADNIIKGYLRTYPDVAKFLENSGRDGVRKGYSRSISGRKRFYNVPAVHDPLYNKVSRGVERQAKNAPIQGSNADTIKQAMIYCVESLERLPYYAKLLLTVHDEIIIECAWDKRYEVAEVVKKSLIEGFGKYFSLIPMETDALIGTCWLKGSCEAQLDEAGNILPKDVDGIECGGAEMQFVDGGAYGTKLVCEKCGQQQD